MPSTDDNPAALLPAGVRFIERDWLSCNQILFIEREGAAPRATLIDSGYDKHAALTLSLVTRVLAEEGMEIGQLQRLINTHLHSDHCGGNALIARRSGARVFVPQIEFDAVRRWDPSRLTFQGLAQRCERFSADGAIAPGDRLRLGDRDWQALAAPGHDPHSLIFYCPDDQLLISADALWENGFGIIFPELLGDSGFEEQQAVLELIASLPVRLVLPGHGRMFSDVTGALKRSTDRLAALRADPRRNARNALKALLKFLLLSLERISPADLLQLTENADIIHRTCAQLEMSLSQGLQWASTDLIAQGQLGRADNGDLINR